MYLNRSPKNRLYLKIRYSLGVEPPCNVWNLYSSFHRSWNFSLVMKYHIIAFLFMIVVLVVVHSLNNIVKLVGQSWVTILIATMNFKFGIQEFLTPGINSPVAEGGIYFTTGTFSQQKRKLKPQRSAQRETLYLPQGIIKRWSRWRNRRDPCSLHAPARIRPPPAVQL